MSTNKKAMGDGRADLFVAKVADDFKLAGSPNETDKFLKALEQNFTKRDRNKETRLKCP